MIGSEDDGTHWERDFTSEWSDWFLSAWLTWPQSNWLPRSPSAAQIDQQSSSCRSWRATSCSFTSPSFLSSSWCLTWMPDPRMRTAQSSTPVARKMIRTVLYLTPVARNQPSPPPPQSSVMRFSAAMPSLRLSLTKISILSKQSIWTRGGAIVLILSTK